jgi:Protein of unknown function (DUF2946)
MRLTPSNRGFSTWLALFALAVQMVISFGHVHLDGIHGAYPAAAATGFKPHAQALPAQPPGDDDDDAYCPICASLYLTANSFMPAAPLLPLPSVSNLVKHFDRKAPVFVAPRRLAFQSRAPPLA